MVYNVMCVLSAAILNGKGIHGEGLVGRDNYSFQKRAKELAKKKKQEDKRQRKLDKKNALTADGPAAEEAVDNDDAAVTESEEGATPDNS
jgi:hypothetical protein